MAFITMYVYVLGITRCRLLFDCMTRQIYKFWCLLADDSRRLFLNAGSLKSMLCWDIIAWIK